MSQRAFILILAAEEAEGQRLRQRLREHRHSCVVTTKLEDALHSIRQRAPDAVVADARLNGEPTAGPLAELLDTLAPESVLLLIGQAEPLPPDRHVQIVTLNQSGPTEQIVRRVEEAAETAVGRREDRLLRQSLAERPYESFEGIIGTTTAMKRIVERIRKAARNKLTVLILGETGTGKDLIAEAIHRQSDRARKPMLAMNCAGLNENLLESHLFGHVKGAFTGAVADRKGYFVAADGSTLFLDEIGDMPLNMQAKLLRVLERREITPVGTTEVLRVDVRVIAATNVNLFQLVQDKKFREDLYYRLNQWVIEVPPLRERRQDIALLAMHFLHRANEVHGTRVPGIAAEAMHYLTRYYWPGNVRELANLVESLVVELESRRIEADDLPESIRGSREIVPVGGVSMAGLTMAQVERLMIERALQMTDGNREQAAKMLDIGTRTLYRKIKEYGLQ